MKPRTRAAALFLAAVLLSSVSGAAPARAEEKVRTYSGWSYVIKDGEITLQRYTGDGTGLVIPAGINGYPVTALGESALENNTAVKYITVSESIRTIGRWAFSGCASLAKVTFKEGSRLESIGDAAFINCAKLEKITLPASLETMGMYVFKGCAALAGIFVEQGNNSFKSRDGVMFSMDGTALYAFPPARQGEYAVPKGVREIRGGAFGDSQLSAIKLSSALEAIDAFAFSGCKSLQAVTLPKGLLEIGMQAFMGCTALESLAIPASVIAIGEGAFMGCERLADLRAAAGSPYYVVRDGALLTADGTELVSSIPGLKTRLNVPDGVVTIRMFALAGSKGLPSASLPESCQTIGVGAFMDCTGLKSVILPEGLRVIRTTAFNNCSALSKIVLPAGLERVESAAFTGCKKLKSVTVLGPDTKLEKGMLDPGGVTLYGYAASTALDYAKENGTNFEEIPTPTPTPTPKPTAKPTKKPTKTPAEAPTAVPTPEPTAEPAAAATKAPTPAPTVEPTVPPTEEPTPPPTKAPTKKPKPTSTASPPPSPVPTPSPTPAPKGPGRMSEVMEVFYVWPYSDYHLGVLYAQMENTGGKPVQFNNGLVELYGQDGNVTLSKNINDCYPPVLAPGETGYICYTVYAKDAKAAGDITDYTFSFTSHGNISADITRYPVKAVYSEVKNGSETDELVTLTIENNTDATASGLYLVFALADADGILLYAYAEQLYSYGLSAHSTIEYRMGISDNFTNWRLEHGVIPVSVNAIAYTLAYR